MANTFLEAQGKTLGKSKVERDKLPIARNFLRKASEKKVSRSTCRPMSSSRPSLDDAEGSEVVRIDADPRRRDGARHRARLRSSASARSSAAARTVFWNGPMGVFEKPKFATGTFAIASRARREQARADRRRWWRLRRRDRAGRPRRQGLARVDRRWREPGVHPGSRPAGHRRAAPVTRHLSPPGRHSVTDGGLRSVGWSRCAVCFVTSP